MPSMMAASKRCERAEEVRSHSGTLELEGGGLPVRVAMSAFFLLHRVIDLPVALAEVSEAWTAIQ